MLVRDHSTWSVSVHKVRGGGLSKIIFFEPVFSGSLPSYWETFGAPTPRVTQNNLVAHHPPNKICNGYMAKRMGNASMENVWEWLQNCKVTLTRLTLTRTLGSISTGALPIPVYVPRRGRGGCGLPSWTEAANRASDGRGLERKTQNVSLGKKRGICI